MASKKSPRRTKSSKIDAFNRSQQIYKLLEKGIMESEALSSSAADRPEDDAHVLELLEGSGEAEAAPRGGRRGPGRASRKAMKRSRTVKRRRR